MSLISGEAPVSIPSGPLSLEGALQRPGAPRGRALLCHPHPQMGGTMHDKVVHHLVRSFQALDFMTLRFNVRGVGASDGAWDEGAGEREDVTAALAYLMGQGAPGPVVLAGYSFGAWVGLRAARLEAAITHRVAVAPPTALMDFSETLGDERPLLILAGGRDMFCLPEQARSFAEACQAEATVEVRGGAEHRFHGAGPWFRAQIAAFMGQG